MNIIFKATLDIKVVITSKIHKFKNIKTVVFDVRYDDNGDTFYHNRFNTLADAIEDATDIQTCLYIEQKYEKRVM